jgi:hypothetical protein
MPPQVETGKEDTKNKYESKGFGDLHDRLRSKQKPGVSFPYDIYSYNELTPDLEVSTLTQYNLKRRLKEFGKDRTVVNTLGKAGAQIPQLPLGDDSPPWGR